MIKSFCNSDTEALFQQRRLRRWVPIERNALRKLEQLDIATCLGDMRAPPGNRLEKLHGNSQGQYSVRINDQWRVCFRFERGNAFDVEIVDYH